MKKLSSGIFAAVAVVAMTGFAGGEEPGIPGSKNCKGQTMAYLAQAGKYAELPNVHGIGGLIHYGEITMDDVRLFVAEYCAG
jgi:hypothetical protein